MMGGSVEDILKLASRHAEWIDVRRLAIARNIANANTPGYRALDVAPFDAVLQTRNQQLATTDRAHLAADSRDAGSVRMDGEAAPAAAVHSGNTVALDEQFVAAGEVARAHALNVAVVRSFHRMIIASAKG